MRLEQAFFIRNRGADLGIRWLAKLGWIGNWGLLARSLCAAPTRRCRRDRRCVLGPAG